MSLFDFVGEYVKSGSASDFVVRDDIVDSYVAWRQSPDRDLPTMQLTDLVKAQEDSRGVLPFDQYRQVLDVATEDGRRGAVKDCWQGWSLVWPNGNKTLPEPAADSRNDPVAEQPQEPQEPQGVRFADRNVHACFHFQQEYEPWQVGQYITKRVTQTYPDDIQHLEEKVKAAIRKLKGQRFCDSSAKWKMQSIEHEGLKYNVFVGFDYLQAASAHDQAWLPPGPLYG